jgi:hypothetical protein
MVTVPPSDSDFLFISAFVLLVLARGPPPPSSSAMKLSYSLSNTTALVGSSCVVRIVMEKKQLRKYWCSRGANSAHNTREHNARPLTFFRGQSLVGWDSSPQIEHFTPAALKVLDR